MSRATRVLALALLLIALALTSARAASGRHDAASAAVNRSAVANVLIHHYLADLRDHNVADLRTFLSPAFQIQRADGSRLTRPGFLHDLPTIGKFYATRNIRATADANVLVVTFLLRAREVVDGKAYRFDYTPQLATLMVVAGGWQLTSYANFNGPAAPSGGLG